MENLALGSLCGKICSEASEAYRRVQACSWAPATGSTEWAVRSLLPALIVACSGCLPGSARSDWPLVCQRDANTVDAGYAGQRRRRSPDACWHGRLSETRSVSERRPRVSGADVLSRPDRQRWRAASRCACLPRALSKRLLLTLRISCILMQSTTLACSMSHVLRVRCRMSTLTSGRRPTPPRMTTTTTTTTSDDEGPWPISCISSLLIRTFRYSAAPFGSQFTMHQFAIQLNRSLFSCTVRHSLCDCTVRYASVRYDSPHCAYSVARFAMHQLRSSESA